MTDHKDFENSTKRHGNPEKSEHHSCTHGFPPLPVVDWDKIGQSAPEVVSLSDWDSGDALPSADVAIMTWTTAEWAAMNQVLGGATTEQPYSINYDFEDDWIHYQRGWSDIRNTLPYDAPSITHKAWGRIKMVKIPSSGKKVLLIKSDMHISTDGAGLPLMYFAQRILDEADPELLLSIGTAGGARTQDCLGVANITNAGHAALTSAFGDYAFNQHTYYSDWTPNTDLISDASELLMMPPVSDEVLTCMAKKDKTYSGESFYDEYGMDVLITPQINKADVSPQINTLSNPHACYTTNSYNVATTAGSYDNWACMEMDDAIIAWIAYKSNKNCGFVRNISDPVVNSEIGERDQGSWASSIYSTFGLYTSYNGALAAWALVAAD